MTDWFIFEEIPRTHYHLFEGVFDYWGKGMKKDIGVAFDILSIFKKGDMYYCFPRKSYQEAGKIILEKTLKNPQWFIKKNNKIRKLSLELIESSNRLQKMDFSELSDRKLIEFFSKHSFIHQATHASGMLGIVLEWDHELLSTYLKNYLKEKIKEKKSNLKLGEAFSILTIPLDESFQIKQEREALEIASKILKKEKTANLFIRKKAEEIIKLLPSIDKKLDKEIEEHYRKYCWLPYMYIGPAWEKGYFIEQISALVKNPEELPLILSKMNQRIREAREKQKKLIKILSIDRKHQTLLGISRELIYLKALRKDAMYFSFYAYEPLLKEIGKRAYLSVTQLRHLLPRELNKAVSGKKFNPNELNERRKFSVILVMNGKWKIFTGKKAIQYEKQAPKPEEYKITELEGSTAVPGMVKGTVKIVNLPEDMPKMQEGNVMVSHTTNPNIVPAMKKAAAIVTDIGGATCHAAIVSRELNIPCVVGTKVATKVFKDGDLIDVNANHGIVKKVKK